MRVFQYLLNLVDHQSSAASYNEELMVRDLRRLADTRFDVLVIGAGVYGAAVAWDAVDRGLSVALVDRGDFGGGTSFNSLKTLHGGLRSLQALNLEQMRRFIRERRALARIVPHLVRPLPFLHSHDAQPQAQPFGHAHRADDQRSGRARSQ